MTPEGIVIFRMPFEVFGGVMRSPSSALTSASAGPASLCSKIYSTMFSCFHHNKQAYIFSSISAGRAWKCEKYVFAAFIPDQLRLDPDRAAAPVDPAWCTSAALSIHQLALWLPASLSCLTAGMI